ncbi:MAG: hypothetical protein Q9219_003715 [cf. Caloplaca sp. 3 TL-2023]
MGVAFGGLRPDLAWRLILGSTVVLPTIVCAQVYGCPESPRWLIQQGKNKKALQSFLQLRKTRLQACRDLYYTYVGVELEREINAGKNFFTMFLELFTVARNRRAAWVSILCPCRAVIMSLTRPFPGHLDRNVRPTILRSQCHRVRQLNHLVYYSTNIFIRGGYSLNSALLASMGTGILNWVFALPAFFTIDKFGRRPLLIFTFPFLAIFLLWTGLSFFIDQPPSEAETTKSVPRVAMITIGMYL